MYSCQECCVVFSGVKLSIRLFYFIMKWTSTQNVLLHFHWEDVCVCVCVWGGGGGGGNTFLNGNANLVLS